LDGDIGAMAFAGFSERAVEEDADFGEAFQAMLGTDGIDKALGGAPGAQSMRAGRAYSYLENIADGDGFVWQKSMFLQRYTDSPRGELIDKTVFILGETCFVRIELALR
jgi:hypothetical protein